MRVLSLVVIFLALSSGFSEDRIIPPMSLEELVHYWGYSFETHYVTTEDGYILGVHRIPSRLDEPPSDVQKPVVLLGHAMLSSSAQWIFGPPEKSLGYVLVDMGYDVWMTNMRGNTFSRNHTHFDPCSSCPEFWSYGFDEGGSKDYLAVVDHIIHRTNVEHMFFYGHSMGTTQFTIFLSTHPEYNSYFKAGFLMAPAVFMGNSQDAIFQISQWADNVQDLFHLFGFYEFLPHDELLAELVHLFCHVEEHPIYNEICANIGFLLLGYNIDQLNRTMLPTYLDHHPAGMSTRPVVHFAQLHMAKDQFIQYDFGTPEENLAHYGQGTPPAYDLSKVTTKIAVYIGDMDDTSTYPDGEVLASALPNAIRLETVGLVGCTHMDFALAMDAREKIYDPIIQLMKEIEAEEVKS